MIILLACSKQKNDRPSPAKDLYQGTLFTKCRALIEANGKEWAILSAKHGLVRPEQVLAPYDTSLDRMNRRDRMCWQAQTNAQLHAAYHGHQLVCLCGEKYRTACAGFDIRVPLFGLPIGEQLHALTKNLVTL